MPGNIPYEPRSRSGSRRVRGKKRSHRFLGGIEPTDVISVWKAGADFVKVFPCAPVGGASYIRALKAPLLRVPLIASGGVHQQTALNFVVAGATALGIGAELIPRESVQLKQEDRILELARWFTRIVKDARRPEH
jgi:2-dehydro-3-deoxyphosphogluconate aldolase/(4S)-4-hydroxy-2-oxoglutarate aldolase